MSLDYFDSFKYFFFRILFIYLFVYLFILFFCKFQHPFHKYLTTLLFLFINMPKLNKNRTYIYGMWTLISEVSDAISHFPRSIHIKRMQNVLDIFRLRLYVWFACVVDVRFTGASR